MAKTKEDKVNLDEVAKYATENADGNNFTLYMEDELYTYAVEGLKEEDMTTHMQVQILKLCGAQGPGVYVDINPHITVTVKAKNAATSEEA